MPSLIKLIPLFLAMAVSLAHLTEARAENPSDEDSEALKVHLELRTTNLDPEMVVELTEWLETKLEERASELGLLVERTPAADVLVFLQISRKPDAPLYLVHSLAYAGKELLVRGEAQNCLRCAPEELVDRGLALLPEVPPALQAHRQQQAALLAPAEPVQDLVAEPPTPAKALGPAGYSGISLAAAGTGLVIGGAVLLARGDTLDEGAPTFVDYRPTGWGLLGGGLAAMVIGNVLLGVDMGPLRARRAKRARIAVTGVGFGTSSFYIQGRF